MTSRYGVGTGASLRDLHSLASRALNTFRGPGLVRYKSRSRRGACAWSKKPADIARLELRNSCKHDCCGIRLVWVFKGKALRRGGGKRHGA